MSEKFNKISGMLVYVQMNEPVKAFVKAGAPKKPDEWKASVVLTDEDYVDELEEYGKSLDTLLSIKKVKTADFEAKYKVAPPEDAGKNVWIFTLRKSTELGKTGKPVPVQYQPRVMQKIKNTMVDITKEKLVGNGSLGTISVDKFERTTGGASLFLKNVLVTDLKEYVASESNYTPGDEFGDDAADDGEGKTVKVPAKAKTAKPKESPKDTPQDDDSQDPF
jgi:hypothetical protein